MEESSLLEDGEGVELNSPSEDLASSCPLQQCQIVIQNVQLTENRQRNQTIHIQEHVKVHIKYINPERTKEPRFYS